MEAIASVSLVMLSITIETGLQAYLNTAVDQQRCQWEDCAASRWETRARGTEPPAVTIMKRTVSANVITTTSLTLTAPTVYPWSWNRTALAAVSVESTPTAVAKCGAAAIRATSLSTPLTALTTC